RDRPYSPTRRSSDLGREPVREGGPLSLGQVEIVFGPPHQDVVGGLRPLLADQIAGLGLVELPAVMLAEIGEARGAADDILGPGRSEEHTSELQSREN